jgi:hypothetical protein
MVISVDLLNVTSSAWTNYPASQKVFNLKHLACAYIGNDTILVSGGKFLNATMTGFWSFNVKSGSWDQLPDLNQARHSHGENMDEKCCISIEVQFRRRGLSSICIRSSMSSEIESGSVSGWYF